MSRSALDFVHRLLCTDREQFPKADELLRDLAIAFGATGAGLADVHDGRTLLAHPADGATPTRPWSHDAALRERVCKARTALDLPRPQGGSLLLTVIPGDHCGLLWLEDSQRGSWSPGEAAALALAGQVLARLQEGGTVPWSARLTRSIQRQRLEHTALAASRLAHDYGNILTGILGFTELSLSQPLPSHSPLSGYLKEVHRATQNGADLTQQLRQVCRRWNPPTRPCRLAAALADEVVRHKCLGSPAPELRLLVPSELPALVIDAEPLRLVLAALLDNARDALEGQGSIRVLAKVIDVTAATAPDVIGDLLPGPHVEICIHDNGPGLSDEARRSLWVEPFFSSHSRRRGFGLAMVHGILSAHHGGLSLDEGPDGGTVARIVLPASAAVASAEDPKTGGEKVLVVDDDPLVRQIVTATLERAGYRVEAVGSAEEALVSYTTAPEAFRLVLSDVVMPRVDGWALARQLLNRDAEARVLFMSGEANADSVARDFVARKFDLVVKPFRTELLLQAVRSALDRGLARSASVAVH